MQTHFLELPDCFMLVNRISVLLIFFDATTNSWILKN